MENSVMELIDAERIARQLRLLNDIQTENMVGGSEREAGSDHFLWSDSMFLLHGLPVSPDNTILVEDAIKLIYEDDRELYHQRTAELEQINYTDYYLRIVTPDAQVKRIHVREKKTEQDGTILFRGNWQDERREKELQQPVRELNQKQSLQLKIFERAEEVGQVGSWQINLETFETIYSDNVYRIYGLAPQSITPHVDSFRKYIHPEDKAVVLKAQEKSYIEIIPLHLEYRIIREDGQIRYISQVSHLLKNPRGEHILSGSTRDVTDQKLLEIQLREANEILNLQNELFIQAEQVGQLGIWQLNMSTRKTVYSANLYRIYGLKPQSVSQGLQNFIQYIHPDDRETVQAAYLKVFEEHLPPEVEFRIVRADGKQRILRQRSRFIKNNGDELLIGIIQDITDHEQKDKLLKETNEKLSLQNESFRQAEKLANIGNWTWNLDTNEMVYTDNVYTIYGLKPQSVLPGYESFGKYMHPDDRKWMKDISEKIRTQKEPISIQYRIIRADGELRYLHSKSHPIVTEEGQTIIIGTTQDITGEVQMQEQLLAKIHFAEMLSDAIIDRIIVTDTANNIISWNKSCEHFYQYEKETVLGKNFFDVFPQLKLTHITEWFKKALNGETIHIPVTATLQIPGRFQELFIVPFKNEHGQVIGLLHVLHDITQQQQLQEQLSNRLHFIEKLQEASIDRMMVLDKDLYFQLWNRECEKYYGHTREQVIGRNILEVFPKFKTDALYQHCLKALEGETVHVPANERAGLAGYQESYFIPLKNELKEVTGLLWVIHDLTERFIAEQRLRTSELHLRTAQEIAMMGSFEINFPGEEIKWSDETYKIFDYSLGEEITLEKIDARIHPDDLSMVHEVIKDLQTGHDIPDSYFRIVNSMNQLKYLHARSQIIRDDENELVKVLGVVQDITERKLAEEQILNQRSLLLQVEEIAHVGSWELELETDAFVWSDEVFRIYGYAPQSFEPEFEFYMRTIHPKDRKLLKERINLAKTENLPYNLTCRVYTLDGGLRFIQTLGRPVADASGKLIRIIGTMQDVTEQKALEEEMRRKNEILRFQYQTGRQSEKIKNVGTFQWDMKIDNMIWGENMFHLVGRNPLSFQPSIEGLLEMVHPEDRDHIASELRRARSKDEGALPDYEFRILVDGGIRYLRFSSRVIPSRSGKHLIGSVLDITNDSVLKQQLSEKILQLEEVNEELTSFAFVASHDLREPLRKIQIFSDWLCQREAANLSEEGIDRFKRIQAAVNRMDVLIDDILSFSRINSSKEFVVFNLNQVLEGVLTDLQETISQSQAVIEVETLPMVKGNPSLYTQLFQNLVSNALKYKKQETAPHIRITCEVLNGKDIEHAAPHNLSKYTKIAVIDNGIGFDPQYSKKIFQMFQRLHGIHEYPGTGMGLAICKKIIEHHGGFIVARSEPGHGSVFECYLPQLADKT